MGEYITAKQVEQIEDAAIFGTKEYHEKLEELTGITAMPYTGYSYYDAAGNYIGDSSDSGLSDLLKAAYIEVKDEAPEIPAAKGRWIIIDDDYLWDPDIDDECYVVLECECPVCGKRTKEDAPEKCPHCGVMLEL